MKARLHKLLAILGDTFWLLPGSMVIGGILLGVGLVAVDRSGAVVLIHQLDVLTAVAGCERDAGRLAELQRHADLVLDDAAQAFVAAIPGSYRVNDHPNVAVEFQKIMDEVCDSTNPDQALRKKENTRKLLAFALTTGRISSSQAGS